jgi:hypothetical protein
MGESSEDGSLNKLIGGSIILRKTLHISLHSRNEEESKMEESLEDGSRDEPRRGFRNIAEDKISVGNKNSLEIVT